MCSYFAQFSFEILRFIQIYLSHKKKYFSPLKLLVMEIYLINLTIIVYMSEIGASASTNHLNRGISP